jgi:hypothetical protein
MPGANEGAHKQLQPRVIKHSVSPKNRIHGENICVNFIMPGCCGLYFFTREKISSGFFVFYAVAMGCEKLWCILPIVGMAEDADGKHHISMHDEIFMADGSQVLA